MKAFSSKLRAFTLVELLVVMGILLLLAVIVVPAAGPMLRGSQLTQGANLVVDQLNLARQTAISTNSIVEVRFYQFGDASVPGQNATTASTGKFRAMQSFSVSSSGTIYVPLGKVQNLPGVIIIDSGTADSTTTLSSIIGSATTSAVPTSSTGATAPNVPIPRVYTSYNCVAFRYLPDGSTNLPLTPSPPAPPATPPPPTAWFITIHGLEVGDALSKPPANYFTIQINANNGHLRTFQP